MESRRVAARTDDRSAQASAQFHSAQSAHRERAFFIKYIERWGTGTERIVKETLAHGLPEPEFSLCDGGLLAVFKKAEALLVSLNERQRKGQSAPSSFVIAGGPVL
ncbi:hypothetical protein L6R21_04575 [bacterium]|nr:hypothetical protein [bacterium]